MLRVGCGIGCTRFSGVVAVVSFFLVCLNILPVTGPGGIFK